MCNWSCLANGSCFLASSLLNSLPSLTLLHSLQYSLIATVIYKSWPFYWSFDLVTNQVIRETAASTANTSQWKSSFELSCTQDSFWQLCPSSLEERSELLTRQCNSTFTWTQLASLSTSTFSFSPHCCYYLNNRRSKENRSDATESPIFNQRSCDENWGMQLVKSQLVTCERRKDRKNECETLRK